MFNVSILPERFDLKFTNSMVFKVFVPRGDARSQRVNNDLQKIMVAVAKHWTSRNQLWRMLNQVRDVPIDRWQQRHPLRVLRSAHTDQTDDREMNVKQLRLSDDFQILPPSPQWL